MLLRSGARARYLVWGLLGGSAAFGAVACSHSPVSRTPQSSGPGFACTTVDTQTSTEFNASAQLSECQIPTDGGATKKINVFKSHGSFVGQSYLHGRMLGELAEQNIFKYFFEFMDQTIATASTPKLARYILDCYSDGLYRSTTPEFQSGVEAFIRGYHDNVTAHGKTPAFTDAQIRLASVATDAGDAVEALVRKGLPAEALTLGTCKAEDVKEALGALIGFHFPRVAGCTGFSVPAAFTTIGAQFHARNLDGDTIEGFAGAPVLFLADENAPGADPKKYFKYSAVATAGMIYPGGISGMNEAGLLVSLHEMQTEQFRVSYSDQSGHIGPFLQHRMLREADTIDKAYAIAQSVGNFIGWSIFVTDAKTGESATIEFNGHKTALYRDATRVGKPHGQTNHFRSPDMLDQFYNYDFNKYQETRARLENVEHHLDGLAPRSFSAQDAIDLLSNHQDAYTAGAAQRAFGRTIVKAYTSLSALAIFDSSTHQFWMSSADRYPVPHSRFAGFEIDFSDAMNFTPIGTLETSQYSAAQSWDHSLAIYTAARNSYAHGQSVDAIASLQQAKTEAARDRRYEPAYDFIRGRILLENALKNQTDTDSLKQSLQAFASVLKHTTELGSLADFPPFRDATDPALKAKYAGMASYMEALTLMYSTHAADALDARTHTQTFEGEDRDARLARSRASLEAYYQATFHFDLEPKMTLVKKLQRGPALSATLPDIDTTVVEN